MLPKIYSIQTTWDYVIYCFKSDVCVVILNLLYYMKFRRVSATPYWNYSLLYFLLLKVFCSTIWNLVEYKLIFLVAILCCRLTIHQYISYVFHGVLLTKLSIVEYNYVYCKRYYWLYQLLLSLKYFMWDITFKIECYWVFAILYVRARFSVRVFSNRISQLLVYSLVSATPMV